MNDSGFDDRVGLLSFTEKLQRKDNRSEFTDERWRWSQIFVLRLDLRVSGAEAMCSDEVEELNSERDSVFD